ncbi:MAG: carbohydrate binding domain-containing protein [Planctomycetota bacterium]
MFRMKALLGTAAALSLMAAGPATAQIELITNGGFESGFAGWSLEGSSGDTPTISTDNPSSGLNSASLVNNAVTSSLIIAQRNIAAGLLLPGQSVTVSFDARGSYAVGGVAFPELLSEFGDPGATSEVLTGGPPLALAANPEEWTTFTFNTTLGADVDGGISLLLLANNGPGSGTSVFYDNVSVTVDSLIPEPTSLLLMGLGGLAMVGRRRKKA